MHLWEPVRVSLGFDRAATSHLLVWESGLSHLDGQLGAGPQPCEILLSVVYADDTIHVAACHHYLTADLHMVVPWRHQTDA